MQASATKALGRTRSSGRPPARTRTRAVAPADKSVRRAAILRAADALLKRAPQGVFSVAELARRAGLAKGTVYLYFGTREEVLLAVHAERTSMLFDTVEKTLLARHTSGLAMARKVVAFLREHPEFLPLAAGCRAMLESNVGVQAAIAYKAGIGERLGALGQHLESAFPSLKPGAGTLLLTKCYAMMIGLWQLADPPACLVKVMNRPDMRVFRIDFERELTGALVTLWEGALATESKHPRKPSLSAKRKAAKGTRR